MDIYSICLINEILP